MRTLWLLWSMLVFSAAIAEEVTIVAAADLRFALDEIVDQYQKQYPEDNLKVIYGSSGKLTTQIINGAPYDVFFSADIAFPEKLFAQGLAATKPEVYAIGRIVIWSRKFDASTLTLQDLVENPQIRRVAIASPAHAPYGMRAKEAFENAGLWEKIQPKLVFGENIAQTAQLVESEAADVGIIALSLALFPSLATHPHTLIADSEHQPLTQGYIVTKRAENNRAAKQFYDFMHTTVARDIMKKYGFVLKGLAS